MIPDDWLPFQIGDVANFSSGSTPSKSKDEFWGGEHTWVCAKDLKQHYLTSSIERLSDEGFAVAKRAPKGASLILVRGMTLLKDFPVGYSTKVMAFNQDVKALVPKDNTDGLFLSFFLSGNRHKIRKLVSTAGHGTGRLDTQSLKNYSINLPPLAEQKKIAQILSTWDKAITTTEQLLANSQQQKKALMQQLLTGRVRLPAYRTKNLIPVSRLGRIPDDWECVPIKNIASAKTSKNTKSKRYPVLSCSKYFGFVDSLSYFKKQVYSDDLSGYRIIERGDFGFPSNHIEEGSIGYQNLCDVGLVSPIYTIFRTNPEKVVDEFLFALLKTDRYRQIFSAATNASVDRRGSLRWKEFSLVKVPLPSLTEQHHIVKILAAADRKVDLMKQQLSDMREERIGLMQQLLTGKRRVSITQKEETTTHG